MTQITVFYPQCNTNRDNTFWSSAPLFSSIQFVVALFVGLLVFLRKKIQKKLNVGYGSEWMENIENRKVGYISEKMTCTRLNGPI